MVWVEWHRNKWLLCIFFTNLGLPEGKLNMSTQLIERPFFIVGNPRSGTTLLRFIISSHPRIHIPSETGFLPFLLQDVKTDLSLSQVKRILERIGQLNHGWAGMVDDVQAFYETLPEPKLMYILDALYRRKIEPYGAVRWGDKGPSYVRYIPIISEIFPRAQFIHLIRDGRDATVSARKKWGNWYMDTYYLLKNWVRNVEQGQRAGERLGSDRYFEVRYEDLVQSPRPVIEKICVFLGERFHPAMLDHTTLARKLIKPNGGYPNVRKPISSSSVQRWKREMTLFEQKMANRIAGSKLRALGYELPELDPFSPTESLKFFFLACKYRLTDTVRRVLYAYGFLTLGRGKRRGILRILSGLR